MKNTSLISSETVQSPIQNGQRFNNNPETIIVKPSQDSFMPPPTVIRKEKPIKRASSKQEPEAVPQIIYGRILEIKKNTVSLRCLIDEDEQEFQIKHFEKKLLKGKVNLVINQLVEIKIYKSQGEEKYTLANSDRQDLTEKFKPKDFFSQFAGSILFQPLPQHIDEDNF